MMMRLQVDHLPGAVTPSPCGCGPQRSTPPRPTWTASGKRSLRRFDLEHTFRLFTLPPTPWTEEYQEAPARLRVVLRKSGRQRNIDAWAERLRGIFTGECLHQPGPLPPESARIATRHLAFAATPAEHYPRTAAAAATLAGYISTQQYIWGLHRILDGITTDTTAGPEAPSPL